MATQDGAAIAISKSRTAKHYWALHGASAPPSTPPVYGPQKDHQGKMKLASCWLKLHPWSEPWHTWMFNSQSWLRTCLLHCVMGTVSIWGRMRHACQPTLDAKRPQ